jgi:hypothetical protein
MVILSSHVLFPNYAKNMQSKVEGAKGVDAAEQAQRMGTFGKYAAAELHPAEGRHSSFSIMAE